MLSFKEHLGIAQIGVRLRSPVLSRHISALSSRSLSAERTAFSPEKSDLFHFDVQIAQCFEKLTVLVELFPYGFTNGMKERPDSSCRCSPASISCSRTLASFLALVARFRNPLSSSIRATRSAVALKVQAQRDAQTVIL